MAKKYIFLSGETESRYLEVSVKPQVLPREARPYMGK